MTEISLSQIHFVEDSDDEVFISRLLLKKEKILVELVHHSNLTSFLSALDKVDADTVSLSFVDLNLPGTKGTEIVSKALEKFERNAIVGVCSGSEDPEDIRLSTQSGAHFFANKPLGRMAIEKACKSVTGLSLRQNNDGCVEIVYSVN